MDTRNLKILVIRLSSLGDNILMLPLLDRLRYGFPDSRIDLATKERYAGLFDENKNINSLYTLKEDRFIELIRLRNQLKGNKYNIVIDAHNVIRSNFLYHTICADRKVQIRKTQIKKWLLIKYKRNYYKGFKSQIEKYFELADLIGAGSPENGLSKGPLPAKALEKADTLINAASFNKNRLIGVAPGARWDTKKWPEEKFHALVNELGKRGFTIVLLGGIEEKELSFRIAQAAQYPLINTTGELSILEAGAVLEKCRLLVTNDSALLHLAEYVDTPVVAIFGPTVREFGYYPRLKESIPVEIELNCRPCSRSGSSLCPLGTKECLTSIRIESILEAIESILGDAAGGA